MDLNSLFFQHQIALLDLAHAPDVAARRVADDCAARIGALRDRLGVPSRTFDFRQLATAW